MSDINTGSATQTGTPAVDSNSAVNQVEQNTEQSAAQVSHEPTVNHNSDKWFSKIEDESLRGYAENRNWKNPDEVVKSYRELETLMGADKAERGIVIPKDDDTEGWTQFYQKLGAPKDATDYKLPVPEGQSPEFAKTAAEWMKELNLTTKQGQGLAAKLNEYTYKQQSIIQAQRQQQSDTEINELRAELGELGYAKFTEEGRRAIRAGGISEETLNTVENAVGSAQMMKMFNQIGKNFSEHQDAPGGKSNFALSKEAARVKLDQLMNDKSWANAYMDGDAKARQEADQLNRIIAGVY